jgi:hypothetical protein
VRRCVVLNNAAAANNAVNPAVNLGMKRGSAVVPEPVKPVWGLPGCTAMGPQK